MPELPEVEFAGNWLERWLRGHRIERAEADPTRIVRGGKVGGIAPIVGRELSSVVRHGKWLLLLFQPEVPLFVHLGMSGKWVIAEDGMPSPRWSRARLVRDDRTVLHYVDPRMFGRLFIGATANFGEVGPLGPDAWTVRWTGALLQARAGTSKKPIKDLLMDQSTIAGLGNIQVTEALFEAKIHPARPIPSLDRSEFTRITRSIRRTLSRSMAKNHGDTITYVEESPAHNPFRIYGRAGQPCPVCGHPLGKLTQSGRTTAFCGLCQK